MHIERAGGSHGDSDVSQSREKREREREREGGGGGVTTDVWGERGRWVLQNRKSLHENASGYDCPPQRVPQRCEALVKPPEPMFHGILYSNWVRENQK